MSGIKELTSCNCFTPNKMLIPTRVCVEMLDILPAFLDETLDGAFHENPRKRRCLELVNI
ncbi:hypothetical protein NECAME_18233 [Necator americanus]|uniref:Uncharacterized protein n=1 Tax=Necator americanus TaxID=51031 RepID=W2TB10_NECAM|nr:hypothetical protein NECAME_18233 [Necator americanus]ETN78202.1 hypothetical protein NECAME_18233 [Necator americanus]